MFKGRRSVKARKHLTTVAAAGVLAVAAAATTTSAVADSFTLRIAAGHPSAPLASVNQLNKTFVPNVTKRVAAETEHKVRFIEGYGGTIANLFEVLESTQKGLVDIGAMCSCFEPTKLFVHNLNYFNPFISGDPKIMGPTTRQIHKEFDYFSTVFDQYDQTYIGGGAFDDYGLGTTFPWTKMEELKGVKIGAAGPNLPWVKGGIPVRTTIPKAAQQLQTGVGEAIVLFPDTDYKLKLHEATKGGFYTVTDFGAVIQISLTMNVRARKKLPPEVVKIIDEEGLKYGTHAASTSQNDHDWGLKKLEEAGVKIRTIDPDAKVAWAKQLADWPNQRAQDVKAKKKVDMPTMMRDYIKMVEAGGHKFPINYEIK
jgi:TRAP-type C4-dicarboxylate transport system substrate-binding protein